MTWFWIALLAPLFFSLSVQIDKLLLSRYFKGNTAGIIVTSAFAPLFFLLPIAAWPGTIWIDNERILAFIVIGILDVAYLYPYLLALKKDEASLVGPLFQLIPVLYFIGGYFFLNETVASNEIVGSTVIIFASLLIVLNLRQWKWEWPVFFLMLSASLLIVTGGLLFKDSALHSSFTAGLFWQHVGMITAGVFLLFFPQYRKVLTFVWKKKKVIIPLTFLNEGVNFIAIAAIRFAALLAPIGLVQTVGGFQPLFIFMWGVLIMVFLPSLNIKENLSYDSVLKKVCAGLLLLLGAWLIH